MLASTSLCNLTGHNGAYIWKITFCTCSSCCSEKKSTAIFALFFSPFPSVCVSIFLTFFFSSVLIIKMIIVAIDDTKISSILSLLAITRISNCYSNNEFIYFFFHIKIKHLKFHFLLKV